MNYPGKHENVFQVVKFVKMQNQFVYLGSCHSAEFRCVPIYWVFCPKYFAQSFPLKKFSHTSKTTLRRAHRNVFSLRRKASRPEISHR